MIEYNTYKEEEKEKGGKDKKDEKENGNEKVEISPKINEVSKWNSLKHGILRNGVSKYDDLDIETLYNNLKEEISPSNILEEMCLEMIVNNYIKINRIQKAELEKIKAILDPTIEFDIEPLIYKQGYIPKVGGIDMESLDLYNRYQTNAENRIYKAIMMLRGLKS